MVRPVAGAAARLRMESHSRSALGRDEAHGTGRSRMPGSGRTMSDIETPADDERVPPAPDSVGIALSGGGIRAAAFSMGVVEELHRALGILRGPNAADSMSAVSGGSYTAGMIALLNAGAQARYVNDRPRRRPCRRKQSPLPRKAVDHVLAHSRYLVDDGAGRLVIRLVLLLLCGLLTVLVLIAWLGTMFVGDVGMIGMMVAEPTGWSGVWDQLAPWSQWTLGVAGIVYFIIVASPSVRFGSQHAEPDAQPARRSWWRVLLYLSGLVSLIATMPLLIVRIKRDLPWLASPSGLAGSWVLVTLIAGSAVILAIVLAALGPRSRIVGAVGATLTRLLLALIPLLIAGTLTVWIGVWMFDLLTTSISATDEGGWWGLVAFLRRVVCRRDHHSSAWPTFAAPNVPRDARAVLCSSVDRNGRYRTDARSGRR